MNGHSLNIPQVEGRKGSESGHTKVDYTMHQTTPKKETKHSIAKNEQNQNSSGVKDKNVVYFYKIRTKRQFVKETGSHVTFSLFYGNCILFLMKIVSRRSFSV